MTETPDTRNIYQRLAAVMKAVTYIQKEQKAKMQYSIVTHDAVTAKVRPALLAEGIVYHPVRCDHHHNGNRAECSMTVRFVNIDNPSDFFDVPTFGYGIDAQDKGPGKAMSYAVKYALLKAMGLETGDDADADIQPHSSVDPHVHQAAASTPPPRDPAKIRDGLLDAVAKRASEADLIALQKEAKFDAAWNWLMETDADKGAEVTAAINAKLATFGGADDEGA